MKFSDFVQVVIVALYNEIGLTGITQYRLGELLERYSLKFNPDWREIFFIDYDVERYIDARRHLGPILQQRIGLSAEGVRWVENEIGENIVAFLEQHGAKYDSGNEQFPPNVTKLPDGNTYLVDGDIPEGFGKDGDIIYTLAPERDSTGSKLTVQEKYQKLIPASDRVVSIGDNSAAIEIKDSTRDLFKKIKMGNDIGDLTLEEAEAAAQEIYFIGESFEQDSVRQNSALQMAVTTLGWIADKAGGAIVGAAALGLLALIFSFFGIGIS